MELSWNSWVIIGAPFVVIAGVAAFYLLRRHKEKPPTEHILKQD